MKLSDVKGERVFDVVADIIEPIASIASDKEAMEVWGAKTLPKEMNARDYLLEKAKTIAAKLIKNHKRDIIKILAAIEGVDEAAFMAGLTMPKLITGIIELLTDDCFEELFTEAQSNQKTSTE